MAYIQTLKNIRDEVLNYLAQAGETNVTKDVIDDTIRRVHAARVTERKWNFMLWKEPQTITTVIGQKFYSLHQEFFRPKYLYNKTGKFFLEQHTEGTIVPAFANDPYNFDQSGGGTDFTAITGSAFRFFFSGVDVVQTQPSSAGEVLSVAGEAAKTVTVHGDTTDGVASETLTVGTPGALSFTRITEVVKGDGWTQTMTLSGATTGTLLKLFASEYGRQYKQIELVASPTAVETIQYQFYRQPSALAEDNSLPNIPAPFGSLLTYDALLQMAAYNDNLTSTLVNHWRTEQLRLENGLIDYDDDVDAMESAINTIRYIER